jgi:hypothetical protein
MDRRVRTIVDLTDRQIADLDRLSKKHDLSRAELVRRAVDRYLAEMAPDRAAGFGLWRRAGAKIEGLAFQRRMRKDWVR